IDGSSGNLIGANGRDQAGDAAARNIISGNFMGVGIEGASATYNVIAGNYLGTDANGTAAIGQAYGILQSAAQHTWIGVNPAAPFPQDEANLISGNFATSLPVPTYGYGGGIGFGALTASSHNSVYGNKIGVGATGQPLGNGDGVGVAFGSSDNVIGGPG